MISISDNSRVKVKNESIAKVTKLLKKLDGIDQVKVCHQNEIGDIYFTYGQDSPKRVSISVEGDEGRPSGIFLGTFTTERSTQSYRVNVKMGYMYESKADYLFYVSGNMLYTLPLKKFRLWVDSNLEMFRSEYVCTQTGSSIVRRHGVLVLPERILRDFAKGEVRVSVFRLKDNPNSETEIDFIQEL